MTISVINSQTNAGAPLAVHIEGDGPPVVLVHGLGFTRQDWAPHVQTLVAAGYRALTYDQRGFGASSLPAEPYDMADLADDLGRVMSAAGVERAHVVGHSLGGMVVQQFAVTHPSRVLSLLVASATSHNGRRASAFGQAMAQKMLDKRQDPARAAAWTATVGFSVKDRLHELQCPTLIAHGGADALIPAIAGALIAKAIPGAVFQAFEGGRHNFPIEDPQPFADALLRHLGLPTP